jgi:acetolactate synthase I/II/III large subunit
VSAGWAYVAELLAEAGCELVAGLPADEPGLLDAAEDAPALRAVVTRDQRVAACLAAGHALVTARPAVLALTTGPAFTNAIAGLTEAASMCVPVVVVTTGVAIGERGRGAFQEVDQQGLAATFAKWQVSVERAEQLRWAIRRGVAQAINGRPGVVVIELALECLAEAPLPARAPGGAVRRARAVPLSHELDRAATRLAKAHTPVVVLGGGARSGDARSPIARLADTFVAAYGTTASGRGAIAEDHPLVCGNVGLYTTPSVDSLLAEADVVLAVGTQLEETARMCWPRLRTADLVHVDCDPEVLGRAIEPTVGLVGDAAATCMELAERLGSPRNAAPRAQWQARIRRAREAAISITRRLGFHVRPTCAVLHAVSSAFPNAVLVQENGLQDMWGYHYPAAYLGTGHTFIAPGEQTMMGFGIGAAIGATLAAPDRPIVVTCGDGAIGMSLAALPTAASCGGRLLIVMWDNHGFGWPRLTRTGSASRPRLTDFPASSPAVEAVRAVGGEAVAVTNQAELDAGVRIAKEALGTGRLALLSVAVGSAAPAPAARRIVGPPSR